MWSGGYYVFVRYFDFRCGMCSLQKNIKALVLRIRAQFMHVYIAPFSIAEKKKPNMFNHLLNFNFF